MDSEVTRAVALSGIPEAEALMLLQTLARVKERKFGRLVVEVSGGAVVSVEIVEKVDRKLLTGAATPPPPSPETPGATDPTVE